LRLAEEGVNADDEYKVDVERLMWWPPDMSEE
jgi:hypothetical protein